MDDGVGDDVRVFVSYSHDNAQHRADVLDFTQHLRKAGIDAEVDQFVEVRPPQSWPRWMLHQIRDSEFVLVVCSDIYRRRVEGDEEPTIGRGASWEGTLITQELYDRNSPAVKFIPVLMRDDDELAVPLFLRGTTRYIVRPSDPETYELLLDNLLYRPRVVRAPVGAPSPRASDIPASHASRQESSSALDEGRERGGMTAKIGMPKQGASPFGEALSRGEPFRIFDLLADGGREILQQTYGIDTDSASVLAQLLDVAVSVGAEAVVVEANYLDIDYRSEWALAYSTFFHAYPSTTHRLHFFSSMPESRDILDGDLAPTYLGYSVMRPFPSGRVGRTLLAAPPSMRGALVDEYIDLFGQRLRVRGFPYSGADRQNGRGSAATAAWMCHYAAVLRGDVPRRTIADFTMAPVPSLALPQARDPVGLTLSQVVNLLESFGLPTFSFEREIERAVEKDLNTNFPADRDRMSPLARRAMSLLSSGLPVLVVVDGQIRVLCGFIRDQERLTFIAHDDDRGPYWSEVMLSDESPGSWEVLLAPVPADVRLSPAAAEVMASHVVRAFASRSGIDPSPFDLGTLAIRIDLVDSATFKSQLISRGVPEDVRRAYQILPLPRHIWVAEITDRSLREQGSPHVMGEVILDATSTGHDPEVLAVHFQGILSTEQYSFKGYDAAFTPYWGTAI